MRDLDDPHQCSSPTIADADWNASQPLAFVLKAARFAATRHAGQTGKGAGAPPYVNHLIDVAERLASTADAGDPVLIAAALLHDSVEKACVSPAEVRALFGPEVAAIVDELTDDPALSDDAQKAAQVTHAPALSRRGKLIKLADKSSNLTAQATEPDADWPAGRATAHLRWARAVADGCRGASPALDLAFDEAAAAFAARHLPGG